jgi:AcrR family transcriptional regulator
LHTTGEKPRRAGRPRDETVGPLILETARDLVVRDGYQGVTTEMIAKAAGVSKQTIYRRWATKADLVLEAFLHYAKSAVDNRRNNSGGDIEAVLAAFLLRTFVALERTGPAIRSLMATAQLDAEFRESFRDQFILPRRSALKVLLHSSSELRDVEDADIEAAVIALYGAVWYRLLLDEPFDASFGQRLAHILLAGLHPAKC